MNAQQNIIRTDSTTKTVRQTVAAAPTMRAHRERDFGVGYGSSSGYASGRRYASAFNQRLFRCS